MDGHRTLRNSDAQQRRLLAGATARKRGLAAALELHGPVDERWWRDHLAAVIARHPVLGAEFFAPHAHRLGAAEPPRWERHTLTGGGDRWARAHQMAGEWADKPFLPAERPLVRAILISAETDHHLLVATIHPMVSDAWSANLLVEEMVDGAGHPDDGYERVWAQRMAWLDSQQGRDAVQRVHRRVAGARLRWPIPLADPRDAAAGTGGTAAAGTGGTAAAGPRSPDEMVENMRDVDNRAATMLQERLRRTRGTLLAAGITALALAVGADTRRYALTSTFAAREAEEELTVVGPMAQEAVIAVPPLAGSVLEYQSLLRREIFATLADQRVPFERVRPALCDGDEGASIGLMFLPAGMSGGQQRDRRAGGASVSRAAISVCPTGAQIDLFMIERPPPRADGVRPLIRLGAMSRREGGRDVAAVALLHRWADGWNRLATADWASVPVRDLIVDVRRS